MATLKSYTKSIDIFFRFFFSRFLFLHARDKRISYDCWLGCVSFGDFICLFKSSLRQYNGWHSVWLLRATTFKMSNVCSVHCKQRWALFIWFAKKPYPTEERRQKLQPQWKIKMWLLFREVAVVLPTDSWMDVDFRTPLKSAIFFSNEHIIFVCFSYYHYY